MITSRSNSLIKEIRKRISKLPDPSRSVVIEGHRLVSEAFDSGASFEALFFTFAWEKSQGKSVLLKALCDKIPENDCVSEEVMRSLSLDESPAGLWALVQIPKEPSSSTDGPLVVLCDVRDPGNAGTLVRTAEGAGASLWFSEVSVCPWHPKVVKASMGSVFRVPCRRGPVVPVLRKLKAQHRVLVGAESRGGIRYDTWDWKRPFALVLGGEAGGVPKAVRELLDVCVSIPLAGKVESLNVAAAGAVLLFHAKLAGLKPSG